MFNKYNTNSLNIINIFSAEVNKNDTGRKINQFGETNFYQLGIKLNGTTDIHYNGKYFKYRDNTVLYLPRENRCDVKYNKEYISPGRGVCIFFNSELPLSDAPMLYDCDKTFIPRLFKEILRSYNLNNMLETKSIFYRILFELDCLEYKSSCNTFKKTVMRYINNADTPDVRIEDMANLFGLSVDRFRHKFHNEFNISPKEFIIRRKIETAKELLLNTNLTVTDISIKSGFGDSNYFSRVFKLKTGVSPSDFRKGLKKFL